MPFVFLSNLKQVALAAVLGCGLLLAPISQAATNLKIGTVIWIGYGPFYVAEALDLFKKSDLKVSLQMFTDPALIPPAIAGGAVDGGMLTYDQVIGQVAKGEMQQVVSTIDYSNGGDAIVADKSITSVKQFKGQKVAFNPLSPSDFLLSYALQVNGMSEKDVQPVNMTPETIPAGMASGSLKLGVTYEPSVSQIIGQDGGKRFHVVFSSKDAPGLITDVLVFDKKYISGHKKEIAGVIQGYVDGLAYMKANPEKSAEIIGKVLGVTGKEVMEQLTGVYNIPLEEMPGNFKKAKATTSLFASGEVISKILKAKGQIATLPRIEDTFDDQFVKAMVKK